MMKKLLLPLMLLVSLDTVAACWTAQDKTVDNFAELEGKLVLTFKDATSCNPISNALVSIEGTTHTTDSDGRIRISSDAAFSMDASIGIKVTHKDYIELATQLRVEAGTVVNKRFILSKILPPGNVRFVLQWDDEPLDLDLHLVGDGFHVSYRDMKTVTNKANLDTDELEGYGPETITLTDVKRDEKYEVFVDNFSGDSNYTGNETLTVYQENKAIHTLRLPAGNHRSIHALDFTNNKYNIKNTP